MSVIAGRLVMLLHSTYLKNIIVENELGKSTLVNKLVIARDLSFQQGFHFNYF